MFICQLDIIETLLKVCSSVEKYAKKVSKILCSPSYIFHLWYNYYPRISCLVNTVLGQAGPSDQVGSIWAPSANANWTALLLLGQAEEPLIPKVSFPSNLTLSEVQRFYGVEIILSSIQNNDIFCQDKNSGFVLHLLN